MSGDIKVNKHVQLAGLTEWHKAHCSGALRKLSEGSWKKISARRKTKRIVASWAMKRGSGEGDRSDKSNNVVILREDSPFYKKMIFRHVLLTCSSVLCVYCEKLWSIFQAYCLQAHPFIRAMMKRSGCKVKNDVNQRDLLQTSHIKMPGIIPSSKNFLLRLTSKPVWWKRCNYGDD